MAKVLLVHLVAVWVVWVPAVLGFPGGDGWEWMSGVADLDGAQFMDFAYPLVQMSANAYRYPSHLYPVPGWSLSSLIAPLHPALGGAHALVFEEHPSVAHMGSPHYTPNSHLGHAHRVILSFRGTQISPSIDSLADVCADKLLWEGFDFSSLPLECLVFDPHTLDYFSQALNYTLQVISLYPSAPILLTGHSLGVGLAILVAGALSSMHTLPVIGFGAPATRKALLDRGLSIKLLENDSIVVIGHEWDVIMRTQMEGQVGSLCLYPQTESFSCKACIASVSLPTKEATFSPVYTIENDAVVTSKESTSKVISSWRRSAIEGSAKLQPKPCGLGGLPQDDCMECFYETHYLKSLIAVVRQGEKPLCQQARDVNLEHKARNRIPSLGIHLYTATNCS